jgi:hypothetical protein
LEALGTVQRLGPESWFMIGSGRDDQGAMTETAGLAWSLDPIERLKALPGIISVRTGAAVTVDGVADASDPSSVTPPMQDAQCDPWRTELEARYGGGAVPFVAGVPDSVPFPGLGLLDFDAIAAAAPVRVSGSGTPEPVEALGACAVDAPWGWGDPDQPWRPGGTYMAFRFGEGGLVLRGGVGPGLLVVDGDVTLADGARYFGMVISRGSLELERGSAFEGLALAEGGLTVSAGSSVRGSACWAIRALDAQRERLSRFVVVDPGARIGPL